MSAAEGGRVGSCGSGCGGEAWAVGLGKDTPFSALATGCVGEWQGGVYCCLFGVLSEAEGNR